jgi:hypothetical protein
MPTNAVSFAGFLPLTINQHRPLPQNAAWAEEKPWLEVS